MNPNNDKQENLPPSDQTQGDTDPSGRNQQSRPPRQPRSGNGNSSGNGQNRAGNGGSRGGNPRGGGQQGQQKGMKPIGGLTSSRGQAVRAQKRSQMDAQRIANQYQSAEAARPARANVLDDSPRLKLIGLGGMDGGGSKNMILVEYLNDAVIMDCGNDLGVDLPGITTVLLIRLT